MAIPKRRAAIPGTYFVTSRTWESRLVFRNPTACELFVETLFDYRAIRFLSRRVRVVVRFRPVSLG